MRSLARVLVLLLVVLPGFAESPADRVLAGGVVHTTDGPLLRDVAVRDGRVVALVLPGQRQRWVGEGTEVVDLGGAHVLPGLIDAHLHLAGYGASLEQADLVGAGSWDEVVHRAQVAAGGLPEGAWLQGRGWDQNLWPEASFPDRAELDRSFPDRPVLLRRVDGHAGVANARALHLAGIDRDTPDPPGGRILHRSDGEPTGVLVDSALTLVRQVIPERSGADIQRQILLASEALLSHGLTQVHDAGTTAPELQVLRQLAAEGTLPIRVYALLDGDDPDLLARELERPPDRAGAAMLRVGGVKLYADGALGSRGALLSEDYADDPGNRGLAVRTAAELTTVARRASRQGYQVAVHAIGDEAVHRVLDVFEKVGRKASRRLRHRIEHSQTVRPGDVKRFRRLGVVASVQPTHCTSDMPWAPDRLGPERIGWAYRWRSFASAGVVLAGGSDAPVEDPDPRRGLFAAVTRQRPDGLPAGGWNPDERLSQAAALDLFTSGAAWAGHAEEWCGAVTVGRVADLTVLDLDPIAVSPERLLHLKVLRTVVDGVDRYVAVPDPVVDEE